MAKLLKLRRGSTSQHGSFTGAEGEVTVDTDKDVLVVHDGSTAGGHPLAAQDMDNVPAGAILGTQLENSGVTAGQYGSSSAIPIVTVDAQGLVTAASTTAIDSTTIANGTSNVAVANNGNITTTRSGTARLVVDDAGVDVTGTLSSGDLTITGTQPKVVLNDSNNENDFHIMNDNGVFAITDIDSNTGRITIASNGQTTISGNLDCSAGLDVTGNITSTGTGSFSNGSLTVTGGEGNSALIQLIADQGDDNGDAWAIQSEQDENDLTFKSNTSGSYVDKLKLKANGNLEPQGQIITGANILIGGSAQLDFTGTNDEKISLGGSSDPYIRFEEGTQDKAYIQWNSGNGTFYFVNQETGEQLGIGNGTNGLQFIEGGNTRTVWHSGNDGTGSGLDADTVDGVHATNFLRTDSASTASQDIIFNGGGGAVSIGANSDVRFTSGNWTGEHSGGKIQTHGDNLYIQASSNGIIFRSSAGADRAKFDGSGHFRPAADNTYDLGQSSYRWRNVYTNDLHLSNEGHTNDVDGTWGDWTIQEGESDLFLKNNRSGKKYKFNLTEIS